MDSVQPIAGWVKYVGTGTFTVLDCNTGASHKCTYEGFLPIHETDAICGLIDDSNRFIKKPLVKLSTDKESTIKAIIKGSKISYQLATKIYNDLMIYHKSNNVSEILDEIAIGLHENQIDDFSILPNHLKDFQIMALLKWWYRSRTLRQLYLLGLNKTEILNIQRITNLSPTKIYDQCLINPFLIIPIPIEKCKEIFGTIGKSYSNNELYRATVARRIYQNTLDKAWTCTPSKYLIDQFKDINKGVVELLKNEYGIKVDMGNLYINKIYQIETEVAQVITELTKLNDVERNITPVFSDGRLTDEQKKAVQLSLNKQISIISGGAGTGKCLHPNTPILMYDGSIRLNKDLEIGDMLMGDDNKPRTVLSLTTGEDEMFEIKPIIGGSFICNKEHILTLSGITPYYKKYDDYYQVIYSKNGEVFKKGFKSKFHMFNFYNNLEADIFDISLEEYLTKSVGFKENCFIYKKSIEFPIINLPIDPYVFGLYFGDSHKIDIRDPYSNLQPEDLIKLKNRMLLYGNYIPDIYKINSRENRIKLLAGLIDKYILTNPIDNAVKLNKIVLNIENPIILKDITFIANSLGIYVNKVKSDGYQLELMGISIQDIPLNSTKVQINNKCVDLIKFNVIPLGLGKYAGFELNGNGRFLLGDFTVTHNTTIITSIVKNLELLGIEYAITSFTGKAVSRIKEIVRSSVPKTMHMMISRKKHISPFKFLIIDEASMITTGLFHQFIELFGYEYQICFVGDVNQLQPFSWGNLFLEIINSKCIDPVYLTYNHRSTLNEKVPNDLLYNAELLIEYYKKVSNMIEYEFIKPIEFRMGNNFFKLEGGLDIVMSIVQMFYNNGVKSTDITVITPYVKYLSDINKGVQEIYNSGKDFITDERGLKWYLGDRVIIITNNYNLNLMNGDEGIIVDLIQSKSPPELLIEFKSGKIVKIDAIYEHEESSEATNDESYSITNNPTLSLLSHSYGITVHKSQGSEYKYVIGYMPKNEKGNSGFINFNLVYTWLTRGKISMFLVGDIQAFELNCALKPPIRIDNLGKRLIKK